MLELRQVIGRRQTREGIEVIAHELDYVIVDGKRIGVITRGDNMPLCFLRRYEQNNAENILDVVAEMRKKQAVQNKHFWAPSGIISMPPSREQLQVAIGDDEDTEEIDDEQE